LLAAVGLQQMEMLTALMAAMARQVRMAQIRLAAPVEQVPLAAVERALLGLVAGLLRDLRAKPGAQAAAAETA